MKEVRTGLVGAGEMGAIHAENLAFRVPGARLVAVCDALPGRAEKWAETLRVERAHEDYRELMSAGGLDAVVVCTPGDTHAEVIEAAAAAGLHIFTEKPLERDITRAGEALAAVRRAGVKLMVAFNRRFDPSVCAVADAARSGAMGTLLTVHIVARDPMRESGVKPPGDIFLDTSIHDLDTARWIAADDVESVSVSGGSIGGLDDPDYALTTLRFRNGVIATIDNNRVSAHGYDQRIEVCGIGGMAATENDRSHLATVSAPGGGAQAAPQPFFAERYAESYLAEMREFVRCILDGSEPSVTGEDGRATLVLALAAHRSYVEGRPVRPDEIG